MHLAMIASGGIAGDSVPLLLLFHGLKMQADVIMHTIEHIAWNRKSGSLSAPNPAPPASTAFQ